MTTDETTEETSRHEADAGAGRRARTWCARLGGALLIFATMCLVSAPVVVYQVHRYPTLSPIDEATYVDYLAKVHAHHYIIGSGELAGPYANHVVECRGVGNTLVDPTGYGMKPDPAACSGAPHAPVLSRDTADIDPPTYYVLTDLGARMLLGFGVTHDLVTAARLVGIFWAGLALSLLFALARLLGAGRLPTGLICLAALGTSGLWVEWTHITPHATDMSVGAGVTLVTLLWHRKRLPAWTLLLAGALPILFKASGAVVVAALVLFAVIAALLARRATDGVATGEPRRLLTGAGLLVLGVVVASAVWLLIRQHYALTSQPPFPQYNVSSFHPAYLLDQIGTFIQPFQARVGSVLTFWAFGSVVRYASDRTASLERRALSTATIPVLIFGAWLFVLSNYVLLHQYDSIPERYGLTVLPAVLALGAVNLRSRWAQGIGAVIVVLLAVETFHPGL